MNVRQSCATFQFGTSVAPVTDTSLLVLDIYSTASLAYNVMCETPPEGRPVSSLHK